MMHAKEYMSLFVLSFGVSSESNSGADQRLGPIFPSVYVHDKLTKPPNITERPKSVSKALPSLLIRTLNCGKTVMKIASIGASDLLASSLHGL